VFEHTPPPGYTGHTGSPISNPHLLCGIDPDFVPHPPPGAQPGHTGHKSDQ
jgi:hypothetical protein